LSASSTSSRFRSHDASRESLRCTSSLPTLAAVARHGGVIIRGNRLGGRRDIAGDCDQYHLTTARYRRIGFPPPRRSCTPPRTHRQWKLYQVVDRAPASTQRRTKYLNDVDPGERHRQSLRPPPPDHYRLTRRSAPGGLPSSPLTVKCLPRIACPVGEQRYGGADSPPRYAPTSSCRVE